MELLTATASETTKASISSTATVKQRYYSMLYISLYYINVKVNPLTRVYRYFFSRYSCIAHYHMPIFVYIYHLPIKTKKDTASSSVHRMTTRYQRIHRIRFYGPFV